MKNNKEDKLKLHQNNTSTDGYPSYPENEDIYNKLKEEENIDPEDVTKLKEPNLIPKKIQSNEKDFDEDYSGEDLDIPGGELDNELEDIGSEDEENNFYSLGGDNHNNLEEPKD